MAAAAGADHYATLGVGVRATTEEIRAAYKRLALLHHPDKNQNDAAAQVGEEQCKQH